LNLCERPDLPGLPNDQDGRVFSDPWQAQAFAITLLLNEKGLFSWKEWGELLAAEIQSNSHIDDGIRYYELWLSALEKLIALKGLASDAELDERALAWQRAAMVTPHGEPVELSRGLPDPETSPGTNRRGFVSNR